MPRTWTKEQKEAAAVRMRARHRSKFLEETTPAAAEVYNRRRPPEVQAVIDSMDPKRKARLVGAQQRVWQDNGRADGKAAVEALERFEQAKRENPVLQEMAPLVPQTQTVASNAVIPDAFNAMVAQAAPQRDEGRIGSREVSLIVRTNGTMVSQYGPCVCGRPKREWHAICCKP